MRFKWVVVCALFTFLFAACGRKDGVEATKAVIPTSVPKPLSVQTVDAFAPTPDFS